MAKFKKKQSDPTPDPGESKNELVNEETNNLPETEPVDSKPDDPPKEPAINQAEKSRKDKKLNELFWIRVGFAVIAGTVATFIFDDIEGEERRWTSIGFMIIVFFGTIIYAKMMNMQLPSSDRKKIVTQGMGSYIFIYLFIWILTFTLVNLNTVSTGIPSPIP